MSNPAQTVALTTHFLDLHLLPDPEFPATQLMNALYAKLHRALFDQLATMGPAASVGVSFPAHRAVPGGLGAVLRLHGGSESLHALMATPWLSGMRDHLQVPAPEVLLAPLEGLAHTVVRRVQAQSNPERLRRRLVKRHGDQVDAEEALRRIPDHAGQKLKLPFIQLRSRSTGQAFPLFIQHDDAVQHPVPGSFNAYGLSQQGATVPWFKLQ